MAAPGCGGNGNDVSESDNLASAQLGITNVPSGVQCVKVVVTVGSQTINPPALTVTAGSSSASLNLGQLPEGSATFQGNAYNVACASVTNSTVANWIADPATATLMRGYVTAVPMTFHQNNNVSVRANFVGNVASVSTGYETTMALMGDGTVTQWGAIGANLYTSPTALASFSNVVQLAVGKDYACARKGDGSVWCWGSNTAGALGPNVSVGGTTAVPVQIPLIGTATAIAAGVGHACAILTGAQLYCWGNNADGEFGNGTTISSSTPVMVRTAVSTVSAGVYNTCITDTSAGQAYCTGPNAYGQLGNGTTTDSTTYTVAAAPGSTIAIAIGLYHTCFLGANNVVHCAGSNATGALGDGTTTNRSTPVEPQLNGVPTQQIQAGYQHTCALNGNAVNCWGSAPQIGAGLELNQLTPINFGLPNSIAVHTNTGGHTCAELTDHSVWCWGSNTFGQIGNGTQAYAPKPTQVVF